MRKVLTRIILVAAMATGLTVGSMVTNNMIICVSEDQHNCIWWAPTAGNEKGDSYIDIMGYTIKF